MYDKLGEVVLKKEEHMEVGVITTLQTKQTLTIIHI